MMFSLVTFIVSGGLLVLFIVLKSYQERTGVLLFWPRRRNQIEKVLQQRKEAVATTVGHVNKKNLYVILHHVLRAIRARFTEAQRRVDAKLFKLMYASALEKIENGSRQASGFLHSIGHAAPQEDKENATGPVPEKSTGTDEKNVLM